MVEVGATYRLSFGLESHVSGAFETRWGGGADRLDLGSHTGEGVYETTFVNTNVGDSMFSTVPTAPE